MLEGGLLLVETSDQSVYGAPPPDRSLLSLIKCSVGCVRAAWPVVYVRGCEFYQALYSQLCFVSVRKEQEEGIHARFLQKNVLVNSMMAEVVQTSLPPWFVSSHVQNRTVAHLL